MSAPDKGSAPPLDRQGVCIHGAMAHEHCQPCTDPVWQAVVTEVAADVAARRSPLADEPRFTAQPDGRHIFDNSDEDGDDPKLRIDGNWQSTAERVSYSNKIAAALNRALMRSVIDPLATPAAPTAEPAAWDQVDLSRVAHLLCERAAAECNVDQHDYWANYGEYFIEDARAVLGCLATPPAASRAADGAEPSLTFEQWYMATVGIPVEAARRACVTDLDLMAQCWDAALSASTRPARARPEAPKDQQP